MRKRGWAENHTERFNTGNLTKKKKKTVQGQKTKKMTLVYFATAMHAIDNVFRFFSRTCRSRITVVIIWDVRLVRTKYIYTKIKQQVTYLILFYILWVEARDYSQGMKLPFESQRFPNLQWGHVHTISGFR